MRFAHRRVRRRDFSELAALHVACGRPAPLPDRATLRRFRRIVADLGADCYVAVERERVIGMVHTTYTRHLADGVHAQVIAWMVAPERRRLGIGDSLLQLASDRARRRRCLSLSMAPGAVEEEIAAALCRRGWQPTGPCFRIDLPQVTGQIEILLQE
jgi:GNAT superfamily N-acetyltransferase